jgi:hypothetical protein
MSWDAPQPGEQPPQQQPYGDTAPYEQPTTPYGQPTAPYGNQWGQYGETQYGGGPYYPVYPPQKRNRNWFYVGLAVVGVVVAVGVAIGVAATSSGGPSSPAAANSSGTSTSAAASPGVSAPVSQSPHTVIVPASAGPLNVLNNADTAQRIANIETNLTGNSAYSNPQIGFYTVGSDSAFSVWMLAETTTDIPVIHDSVHTLGDAAMAHQIALGAKMTDVATKAPGPLGGALLCGKLALDGATYRVCEWVDDSTFGWVYFKPSVPQADVLIYALDLRRAAEQ